MLYRPIIRNIQTLTDSFVGELMLLDEALDLLLIRVDSKGKRHLNSQHHYTYNLLMLETESSCRSRISSHPEYYLKLNEEKNEQNS